MRATFRQEEWGPEKALPRPSDSSSGRRHPLPWGEGPAPACTFKSLLVPSPPTSRHASPPGVATGSLAVCSLCSTRTPLPGEHAGAGSSRWQAAWPDIREGRRFLFKHQLQRQKWLVCQACGSTHFLTLPAFSWQLRLAPGFLLPSRTCSPAENISSFCNLRARLSGQPRAALGTTDQRADLGWGWGSW